MNCPYIECCTLFVLRFSRLFVAFFLVLSPEFLVLFRCSFPVPRGSLYVTSFEFLVSSFGLKANVGARVPRPLQGHMNLILLGIVGSLCAGLATAVGAIPVFFIRELNKRWYAAMLGFAAGIMLAASFFSLLAPALEHGAVRRAERPPGAAGKLDDQRLNQEGLFLARGRDHRVFREREQAERRLCKTISHPARGVGIETVSREQL